MLATSGMMNGGPVMEYFKAWSADPKHTLVFVGYQADGTLGKKIQSGAQEITLSGEGKNVTYPVKMDVETAEGFSGHSTKKQLLAYIATMQPKPKKILVNHGDNGKTAEFARLVRQRFNIEAYALKNLETIRLL
nr:MBL fold metallo-hydrolase RNA specificity domain-containing protein [Thermoplasma acidophilum]